MMSDEKLRGIDFHDLDSKITRLDIPGFTPSTDTSTPQQLTWVQARTTWFRQTEATSPSVLWIATTDTATVYRAVDQAWLASWQNVLMNAQVLWLQVDTDNIIRAWQPGRAF